MQLKFFKPRMDTDEHGFSETPSAVQRCWAEAQFGGWLWLGQKLFLSVLICVHPWLKIIFNRMVPLSPARALSRNPLDNETGGGETEGTRYKSGGAKAAVAIELVAAFSRRAFFANGAIGLREHGRFGGEDAFDPHGQAFGGELMLFPQVAAHFRQQFVVAGFGEIAGAHPGAIAAAPRAAAGDDREIFCAALREQQNLVGHAIDGIHDEIVFRGEQFVGRFGVEKAGFAGDAAFGIDGADALGHDLHLRAANGFGEGVELAVDVGDADFVQIHQSDRADARAGQGFGGPSADPANANHRDMRRAQPRQARPAIEPGDAAKTIFKIRHALLERILQTAKNGNPSIEHGLFRSAS
jgi:hypothetical protein